jgi:phosphoribosylanthranilate isomerase
MWIKICGITSLEDAEMAVAAGADAVGFVFAESPRRVTLDTAYKIVVNLPKPMEKIGVFVDADFEKVLAAIQWARLTGAQLHGENSAELARKIRERADKVSLQLHVIRVLHYAKGSQDLEAALHESHESASSNSVLVDTRIDGKKGGTGVSFDWREARDNFRQRAPHHRWIVAGGLNPQNVGEAIRTLRPWGVDVSSGVEASPGRKDRMHVAEFVRAARTAAMECDREQLGVNA